MYLEVEQAERSDDREWQMKMALLGADPDRFGPVIFPVPKAKVPKDEIVMEELQPGDITSEGFHPDITVRYKKTPTAQEVDEILAQFPQEQLLGLEDFKRFGPDERLANGQRH